MRFLVLRKNHVNFLPVVVVAVAVVVAPPVYRIAILNWVKEGCRKNLTKSLTKHQFTKKLRNHTRPF